MNKFQGIIDKNAKVVVFGGAGFIGSNISETLAKLGNEVLIIDNLFSGSMDNIEDILKLDNVQFALQDICDLEAIIELTKGYDYFIQQAAWGSVPRSMNQPEDYIINNEVGTFNVFMAGIKNKIKAISYASSSSVYGDHPVLPKVEHQTGNILSPYALTKKHNEDYAKLFAEIYDLKVIGLRYFNIFGPRQSPESAYAAVIPKFIHKIKNNEKIEVYGDGLQSRDFTYVDNAVFANLLALKNAENYAGKVYNVACNDQIDLKTMINDIEAILKIKVSTEFTSQRPGDIKHSKADITSIQKDLNYEVLVDYHLGIQKTIDYFEKNSK